MRGLSHIDKILVVVGLVLLCRYLVILHRGSEADSNLVNSSNAVSGVHEVFARDLEKIHPYKCIRTKAVSKRRLSYIMCLKPLKVDKFISGGFDKEGMYEKEEVELILDLTTNYPGGTFLDLGANIGTFSVAVAASKYNVVSVDPVGTNLAYIKTSVELFGTENYVRYIQNTISDEFIRLYPWNHNPENEGALNFLTKEEAAKKPAPSIGEPVDSATLEQIISYIGAENLTLKVDVEGYECKTLNGFLKNQNKAVNVPYILMEWIYMSRNHGNLCPDLPSFIQGFVDSGYSPYDPLKRTKVRLEDEKKWNNVLWVHKDAKF